MKPTRIVIVDKHPIVRMGFAHFLARSSEVELVGEGASGEDALRLAMTASPDIMFLDLPMCEGGGDILRHLASGARPVKPVILTASECEKDLMAAMAAGAHGYILKDTSSGEILEAIRAINAGKRYVTPSFAAVMLTQIGGQPRRRRDERLVDALSAREVQVLRKAAKGATNREIADSLKLSEKTVKHYMTIILQKMNVRNRVEAALLFRECEEGAGDEPNSQLIAANG